MTVFKYTLPITNSAALDLPHGAEVLSVLNQREDLVLYVKVDPSEPVIEERHFVVRGTGHPFDGNEGAFIGSVSFQGGALIFHVFHKR